MSTAAGPHDDRPVTTAGPALGESHAALVLVHGRNAAPRNILDVANAIGVSGITLLAPAAAGNTWYPHSFMAETASNEPGLSSGLRVLHRLVGEAVDAGVDRRNILLLGFSQGACLTAEYAVRHAGRLGGVIVFSGGLIGPPGTRWDYPGSFEGSPVFLGCSDIDGHVPKARVEESAAVFERMGADVTARIYPGMGHLVNEDELQFARDLIDDVRSRRP